MRLSSSSMTLTSIRQLKVGAGKFNFSKLIPLEGAIVCKFRASGQTCVCANRIYVHSSVYADFASRLAEKVAAFKVGNGLDEKTLV